MSYDIWLEIDTGGAEPAPVGNDWNYTSNMSGAWRAAGADLAEFDGRLAGDCRPILFEAIKEMRANPEKYRAMDAPNGWGTYDTLLPALDRLLIELSKHPKAIVRVSR